MARLVHPGQPARPAREATTGRRVRWVLWVLPGPQDLPENPGKMVPRARSGPWVPMVHLGHPVLPAPMATTGLRGISAQSALPVP